MTNETKSGFFEKQTNKNNKTDKWTGRLTEKEGSNKLMKEKML